MAGQDDLHGILPSFFRRQYMAHVLAVQKPCTRSIKPMYSEYKAHVLQKKVRNVKCKM